MILLLTEAIPSLKLKSCKSFLHKGKWKIEYSGLSKLQAILDPPLSLNIGTMVIPDNDLVIEGPCYITLSVVEVDSKDRFLNASAKHIGD